MPGETIRGANDYALKKYGTLFANVKDISTNCKNFGNYYQSLDEDRGYCHGILITWALLWLWANELLQNKYSRAFSLLTKHYPLGLSTHINNALKGRPSKLTNLDAVNILAILDSILLHQGSAFTSLCEDNINRPLLVPCSVLATSEYAMPDKLFLKNSKTGRSFSVTRIFHRPFVGDKSDYESVLKELVDKILPVIWKVNFSAFFTFRIFLFDKSGYPNRHTVGFGIDARGKAMYCDANILTTDESLPLPMNSTNEIVDYFWNIIQHKRIKLRCKRGEPLLITNISIYFPPQVSLKHPALASFFSCDIYKQFLLDISTNMRRNDYLECLKKDYTGEMLLFSACQYGHNDIVQMLINRNINLAYRPFPNNATIGTMSLWTACVEGFIDTVKTLLFSGKINCNMKYGKETPIFAASQCGHAEIVDILLQRGADCNEVCDKATPLWVASYCGHADVVKTLLKRTREVNSRCNGISPLFVACEHENIEVVECLLEDLRVDVNLTSMDGKTPLFTACDKGYADIAQLLLSHKNIDINKATGNLTPLTTSCLNSYQTNNTPLLRNKNFNTHSRQNIEPVYDTIIRLLLDKGASISPDDAQLYTGNSRDIKNRLRGTRLGKSERRDTPWKNSENTYNPLVPALKKRKIC